MVAATVCTEERSLINPATIGPVQCVVWGSRPRSRRDSSLWAERPGSVATRLWSHPDPAEGSVPAAGHGPACRPSNHRGHGERVIGPPPPPPQPPPRPRPRPPGCHSRRRTPLPPRHGGEVVRLPRWIRARRRIRCAGIPRINHEARIRHENMPHKPAKGTQARPAGAARHRSPGGAAPSPGLSTGGTRTPGKTRDPARNGSSTPGRLRAGCHNHT